MRWQRPHSAWRSCQLAWNPASTRRRLIARADDFCSVGIEDNPVPTSTNPLGVKGAGEAGTVGSLSAGVNAIVDALSVLGIRHIDTPCTPYRVWQAIQDARTRDVK